MRFLPSLPLFLLLIFGLLSSFESLATPTDADKPRELWPSLRLHRSIDGSAGSEVNSTVNYDSLKAQLDEAKTNAELRKDALDRAEKAVNGMKSQVDNATRDYEEKKKEWEKWKEVNKWKKAKDEAQRIITAKEGEILTLNGTIADLEEKLSPFEKKVREAKQYLEDLNDIDNVIATYKAEIGRLETEIQNKTPDEEDKKAKEKAYDDLVADTTSNTGTFSRMKCNEPANAKIDPCKGVISHLDSNANNEPIMRSDRDQAILKYNTDKQYFDQLNSNKSDIEIKCVKLELAKDNPSESIVAAKKDLTGDEKIKEIKEKPLLTAREQKGKAEEELANAITAKTEAEGKITDSSGDSEDKENVAFLIQTKASETLSTLEGNLKEFRNTLEEKQKEYNNAEKRVGDLQLQYDKRTAVSKGGFNPLYIIIPIACIIVIGIVVAVGIVVIRRKRKRNRKGGASKRSSKAGFLQKFIPLKSKKKEIEKSSVEATFTRTSLKEVNDQVVKEPVHQTMTILDVNKVVQNLHKTMAKKGGAILVYGDKSIRFERSYGWMYISPDGTCTKFELKAKDFNIVGFTILGDLIDGNSAYEDQKRSAEVKVRPRKSMFKVYFTKNSMPVAWADQGRLASGADRMTRKSYSREAVAKRWWRSADRFKYHYPLGNGHKIHSLTLPHDYLPAHTSILENDFTPYPYLSELQEIVDKESSERDERESAGVDETQDKEADDPTQTTVSGAQADTNAPDETTARIPENDPKEASRKIEIPEEKKALDEVTATAGNEKTEPVAEESKQTSKISKVSSRGESHTSKKKVHSPGKGLGKKNREKGQKKNSREKGKRKRSNEERKRLAKKLRRDLPRLRSKYEDTSSTSSSESTNITSFIEKIFKRKKATPKPVEKKVVPITAEELDEILLLLCNKKLKNEQFLVKQEYIDRILQLSGALFEKGPRLIDTELPATVVTDIHGRITTLMHMFASYGRKENQGFPIWKFKKFVFLGDYIDRGKDSIQVILLLLLLKLRHPEKVVLLRGNHEDRTVNKNYGFEQEIKDVFGEDENGNPTEESLARIHKFNDVFARMPLCARLGGKIFCCHGGIPRGIPRGMLAEWINRIPAVLHKLTDNDLAAQLLWNDPIKEFNGFAVNYPRGAMGLVFGEQQVNDFCSDHGIELIVRGHQMVMLGYEYFAGDKLVTIFTCADYDGKGNHGATIDFRSDGSYGIRIYVPVDDVEDQTLKGWTEAYGNFNEQYYDTTYHYTPLKYRQAKENYEIDQAAKRQKALDQQKQQHKTSPQKKKGRRDEKEDGQRGEHEPTEDASVTIRNGSS